MKMQTPYYVIHKQELDVNFRKLKDSLEKHWSNYIIGYSYKTNALPWFAKHFDKLGCYAEVVSEDEYKLAQRLGVSKDKIIYNGPIKTKESFLEAIENKCIVNIDAQREIEWLEDVKNPSGKIGLRINFDIEKTCPMQSQCGDEGGRFGFCYENGEFEMRVGGVFEKIRLSGYLHTIVEPTILSNTHEAPIYAKTEKELKIKDMKEDLVLRKEIDFNDND